MTEEVQANEKTNAGQTAWWVKVLVSVVAALLAGLVLAPLSLSGQDLINWARTGLGLTGKWPWIVFYALDASAIVCVLMAFRRAWKGQSGGVFQLMVWTIAGASAFANYRHGIRSQDWAPDAWWFFPGMSLLSPLMLELVLLEIRKEAKARKKQVAEEMPSFGFWRWIPGVGAFRETYGAWRTARLLNLSTYEQAVQEYRRLCPTGSMRVLKAIRAREQALYVQPQVLVDLEDKTRDTPVPDPVLKQQVVLPIQVDKAEDKTTDDLYIEPIQEAPVLDETETAKEKRRGDNEQYLDIIRSTWPDSIPPGNQIRTKLGVNYVKSKQLINIIKDERGQEE